MVKLLVKIADAQFRKTHAIFVFDLAQERLRSVLSCEYSTNFILERNSFWHHVNNSLLSNASNRCASFVSLKQGSECSILLNVFQSQISESPWNDPRPETIPNREMITIKYSTVNFDCSMILVLPPPLLPFFFFVHGTPPPSKMKNLVGSLKVNK